MTSEVATKCLFDNEGGISPWTTLYFPLGAKLSVCDSSCSYTVDSWQ